MQHASWTVDAALYGWPLAVALAFSTLRPAWATLVCYVAGWLFLPVAGLELFGFLDYNKATAVPLVVTAAIVAFDGRRLSALRLRAADLPLVLFCTVPLATSLSNGLGLYDGVSSVAYALVQWGLPYLAGRLYCATPEGQRRLATAIVCGGLVYVPLCLWEVRMSPQLHRVLYGFHQHDWLQVLRGSGYRPVVFMHHGLMTSLWMAAAALLAFGLWSGHAVRRVWGVPAGAVVVLLVGTTLLCKSLGAIVLLAGGIGVLVAARTLRTSLPVALLLCLPTLYVGVRLSGDWSGQELVTAVERVSADRASSLAFRIDSEELLREKALQRPILGWGGWGRNFVRQSSDPGRHDMVTTDSLWIIVAGKYGLLGLAGLLALFAAPLVVLWRRWPPRRWAHPAHACSWSLAIVFAIYALDNLVNAMHDPVFLIVAGALCGLAPAAAPAAARARAPQPVRPAPAGAPPP